MDDLEKQMSKSVTDSDNRNRADGQQSSLAQYLGQQIRMGRKEYRLTQQQFAELIGISDRTLRDIEKGTGTPSLNVVLDALSALGLSLEVK